MSPCKWGQIGSSFSSFIAETKLDQISPDLSRLILVLPGTFKQILVSSNKPLYPLKKQGRIDGEGESEGS